jgi:PIN domain nuclease of toxin-antitoxin system
VLLWSLAGADHLLPPVVRSALASLVTDAVVSAATAWEIEIKRALGKLEAPDDLADALAAGGYRPLAISVQHAVVAGRLPPRHRDPFDRMLVAQATIEGLTIVTGDRRIADYDVPVLWE